MIHNQSYFEKSNFRMFSCPADIELRLKNASPETLQFNSFLASASQSSGVLPVFMIVNFSPIGTGLSLVIIIFFKYFYIYNE